MDREQAQELFSSYREGDLTPDQVEAFEHFLEEDDETRLDYELFCRTIESLSSLRSEPAPDDFMDKLKGRMKRRSGGKLFGSKIWGTGIRMPYELFSLILILIILSLYLLTLPMVVTSSRSTGEQNNATGQQE